LQAVELDPEELGQKTVTVVSQPRLAIMLGLRPEQITSSTVVAGSGEPLAFTKSEEQKVAQIAHDVIRKLESQPETVATVGHLTDPAVQAVIVREVEVRADSS
jgi:type III restriction enzyme